MNITITTEWHTDSGIDPETKSRVAERQRYLVIKHDLPIPSRDPSDRREELSAEREATIHQGISMPAIVEYNHTEINLGHIILTEDDASPDAIERAERQVFKNALTLQEEWYGDYLAQLRGVAESHAEDIRKGVRDRVYLDEHDGVEATGDAVIAYIDNPFVDGELIEVDIKI